MYIHIHGDREREGEKERIPTKSSDLSDTEALDQSQWNTPVSHWQPSPSGPRVRVVNNKGLSMQP